MLRVVFVGAWKDRHLQAVSAELEKRLRPLWRMTVEEAPESPKALTAFLQAKAAKSLLVSLDPTGESMDSVSFARWVTAESRDLTLVVWGAAGPTPELKGLAARSLSLSAMTLSHELCRVFLLEQVYRAACILKGHPYPK